MEIKIDFYTRKEGSEYRQITHGVLTESDILDLAVKKYRDDYTTADTDEIEATIDKVII